MRSYPHVWPRGIAGCVVVAVSRSRLAPLLQEATAATRKKRGCEAAFSMRSYPHVWPRGIAGCVVVAVSRSRLAPLLQGAAAASRKKKARP